MTNQYYTTQIDFTPGTKARSVELDSELGGVEAGFDKLPSEPTSLHRGTAEYGTEVQGATVNDYVVTMPTTRTSNQEGDHVVFKATHTNTAAVTLNVDSLGAIEIKNLDNTSVASGDIQNGAIYEVRFTGSFYQLTSATAAFLEAAANSAAAAAVSAGNAATSETNASNSAAAAAASESNAATSETNASNSASAASISAGNAFTSASNASTSESNAATSAGNASTSETNASNSASTASTSETNAASSSNSAVQSADDAEQWAIRAEDDPVPVSNGGNGVDTFSALHWAAKASGSASGQMLYQGNFDAGANVPPPTTPPVNIQHVYRINTAGTISGLVGGAVAIGDNIIYDGSNWRIFSTGGA